VAKDRFVRDRVIKNHVIRDCKRSRYDEIWVYSFSLFEVCTSWYLPRRYGRGRCGLVRLIRFQYRPRLLHSDRLVIGRHPSIPAGISVNLPAEIRSLQVFVVAINLWRQRAPRVPTNQHLSVLISLSLRT
jgi:hypothetical protein